MDSLQGGPRTCVCRLVLRWAFSGPSPRPFGESSTRICVRFLTFSAGYPLVVQSTEDSSGNAVDVTWPFVLAFFPLVKSLEKLRQPLPVLANWIGGQNKTEPKPNCYRIQICTVHYTTAR